MAEDSQLEYEEEQTDGQSAERPAATAESGTDLPLKEGAVFGAAAFLLSYAVTWAMTVTTFAASAVDTSGDVPGTFTVAGWSLLANLGSAVEMEGEPISIGSELGAASPAGYSTMIVLTFLIIVAAGFALARYEGAEDLESAAKSAVLVVPGYLVLALLVAVATSWESNANIEFAVATGDAVLYSGILFPALFGLIGGLLAVWPAPVDRVMAQIDG
ncbi:hypothetical protein ACFO5R_01880 [Halosolutus amylolyticus]|uniref:DUF7978 domain-containing protein n=1 Tax=Halosolutus amylolyticus TaxID=2932267 RepID=A0ABD5PL81_9EURY|nr:hypothetical protein [Halosolutus amylolyticus]